MEAETLNSRIVVGSNGTPVLDSIITQLPTKADQSDILILTPELSATSQFRHQLLAKLNTIGAALPPRVYSLRSWIEQLTGNEKQILNNHARELMLVEVLRDSEQIKGKGNAWQLADELLKLFDELELSGHDAESLILGLANSENALFVDDANKVSFLWEARLAQMEAENVTDRIQLYSKGLREPSGSNAASLTIIAGFDWLHKRELEWLRSQYQTSNTTIVVSDKAPLKDQLADLGLLTPSDGNTNNYFDSCYAQHPDLLTRSEHWRTSQEHNTNDQIETFSALSGEQEARFIDAQIRDWLAQGKQNIALITEDRQLARRVSAILQHAGLAIHDDAGWPLSTTIAAGCLERWLECLEENFIHRALLDVLKSPFIHLPGIEQKDIFHFERDIIEHEGVASGLDNYRQSIQDRAKRLEGINPNYPERLLKLLETLTHASQPILHVMGKDSNNASFPLSECISALTESLSRLGLTEGYTHDTAGQRLLQEIEDMRQSESGRSVQFTWHEFRSWLKRALETHNFRPARESANVRIMTLQQSLTGSFDAVILAGMDSSHLPKPPARLIFFNDQVKQQLGLLSSASSRHRQFFQLRRLLEATPNVVLSYSQQNNGSPQLPSPWLSKLIAFNRLTRGNNLPPPALSKHQDLVSLAIGSKNSRAKPTRPQQPSPIQPAPLLPTSLSASSHQQLIDCPYKFFSAYALGLRAPDDIVEQLNNRDYGNRAHTCLQAFHSNIPSLPGPFIGDISLDNLQQAKELLLELGEILFEPEKLEDLRHKNWFSMWQALIPHYLRWQMKRQKEWSILQTEHSTERPISDYIVLKGKLDRLDKSQSGNGIIDYKTGALAKPKDMLSGENVQLSTYALLVSNTESISYLALKASAKPSEQESNVSGEKLHCVAEDVEERLKGIAHELEHHSPMPANGDDDACRYCPSNGLCRKEMWLGEELPSGTSA